MTSPEHAGDPAAAAPDPPPPIAPKREHASVVHGVTLDDPWFWLREREDPETLAYLEAENAYTKAQTNRTEPLRERLYEEIKARIQETDLSVPARKGPWLYYSRTEEGKSYAIHCRRRADEDDSPEEILLDENEAAEGHSFFEVGGFAVSPDHRLLAYSIDTEGGEKFTLRVKDLTNGEHLPDEIRETAPTIEWANDNRTIFYGTLDEAMRPDKLYRHSVGSEPGAKDELVFHEKDESFFLGLTKTRSERFLLLELVATASSEIRVLDADDPDGSFRCLVARQPDVETVVDHHGDRFLVLTNDSAKNFRLLEAPLDAPSRGGGLHGLQATDHILVRTSTSRTSTPSVTTSCSRTERTASPACA